MSELITAAVLGGSGFIGAEVLRLLAAHPGVEPVFVSAERQAGQRVGQVMPALRNTPLARQQLRPLNDLPKVDVAVSCLPTGVLPASLEHVTGQADLVINVAGDYRLRHPDDIARHYPESVAGWREPIPYYLPDFSPKPAGQVISLPGCMAVASILALYPLLRDGLVEHRVVVEAKTGSSGAGHVSTEHPAIRDGNVRVHKLHGHRHGPEVRQALGDLTGVTPDLQFTAISLPVSRGVLACAYTWLAPGVTAPEVRRAYGRVYRDTPFVHLNAGRSAMTFPMLKTVVGTNNAEVGFAVEDGRCVSVTAVDNVIKGGAGQAVQAINRIFGLPETLGLPEVASWP